jgi:probable F420-dependent oxidoreductase
MLPQTNRIASPTAMTEVAQAAEDLGFFGVIVHDHLGFNGWWVVSGMRGIDLPGDDRTLYEALESLAFVAAVTERIRLGISVVIVAMRKPVALAKQLSTIDALSGGRLRIGVGVGPPLTVAEVETTRLGRHRDNAAREFNASGLRGERGKRTDEYLQAMITLWTEDEASFAGDYVAFEGFEMFPKPVQKPYPPLLVGGRSEMALRRAARFKAGWVPSQVSAPQLAAGVSRLGELYSEAGEARIPEIVANLPVVLAATDEEAERIARSTVLRVFPGEREYRERTIVGSPATFADRLREYRDAGASHVELKPLYPSLDHLLWQLKTFQAEVVPMLGPD